MSKEAFSEDTVRLILQKAISRNLWMAVPEELEGYIASYAHQNLAPDMINEKPWGPLSVIAGELAWAYHAGCLDIGKPDPYGQLEDIAPWDLPPIQVITPHGMWVSIRHESECEDPFDPEFNFYGRGIEKD